MTTRIRWLIFNWCFFIYFKIFIIFYSQCFTLILQTYDVVSTSIRLLCDVTQTLKRLRVSTGKRIKFCIIGKVLANLRGLYPNLRGLWNLIPLKCISYLHKVALFRFHSFPWKGYNFHRLKDIFLRVLYKAQWRNYFPDSFTQSVVDPFCKFFIFRKSIRSEIWTKIKYDIHLSLTLLPYKLNIAVN